MFVLITMSNGLIWLGLASVTRCFSLLSCIDIVFLERLAFELVDRCLKND